MSHLQFDFYIIREKNISTLIIQIMQYGDG